MAAVQLTKRADVSMPRSIGPSPMGFVRICGIVGILGREPVAGALVDALRRLEYRGSSTKPKRCGVPRTAPEFPEPRPGDEIDGDAARRPGRAGRFACHRKSRGTRAPWVKARYIDPAPLGNRIIRDPVTGLERVFIRIHPM